MKKTILLIITICSIFVFTNSVKADAAVPIITSYEAIVTNKNGARALSGKDLDLQVAYFDNDEFTQSVIPYNSVVVVTEELAGMLLVEYNGNKYAVEEENIAAKNETYPLEKATKMDKEKTAMTVQEETSMYNGPSYIFKEVSTIPEDVTLKYSYKNGDWIYVEYNNNKGWIRTNAIAKESSQEITLLNDYKLNNVTIKKGTTLKCIYIYHYRAGTACYVEYNNVTGWLDSYDIEKDIEYFKVKYEDDDEPSSEEEPIIEPEPSDVIVEPSSNSEVNKIESNVLLYVGAALIVALTAIVTIILINKKNKKVESE